MKIPNGSVLLDKESLKIVESFFDKKIKRINLLYNANKDGWGMKNIENKVNGRKNIISLIQSEDNYVYGCNIYL